MRPNTGCMNEAIAMEGDDPKLDELDKLLNDPEVPMEASRIWELLAEISLDCNAGYSCPPALPA